MTEKVSLYIPSKGMRGNKLFYRLREKIGVFQYKYWDEHHEKLDINDMRFFIDGVEWLMSFNSDLKIEGMHKADPFH